MKTTAIDINDPRTFPITRGPVTIIVADKDRLVAIRPQISRAIYPITSEKTEDGWRVTCRYQSPESGVTAIIVDEDGAEIHEPDGSISIGPQAISSTPHGAYFTARTLGRADLKSVAAGAYYMSMTYRPELDEEVTIEIADARTGEIKVEKGSMLDAKEAIGAISRSKKKRRLS